MDSLEQAFYTYQEKTRAVFQEAKDDANDLDSKDQLLSAVKSLEIKEQQQYKNLLKAVDEKYSEQYKWDIEKTLKAFLRRSSFYLNLFEGKEVDPVKYVTALQDAFDKVDDTVDRWYIVPIEGTWLKDEILVNDGFKIISLEAQEWEQKLLNRPNKFFYPQSHVNAEILCQYDCLAIRETVSFKDLRRRSFSITQKSDYIPFNYSSFPSLVEEKIGQLILAKWKSKEIDFSSFDHELWFPVVMRVHHSLIDTPYAQPGLYGSLNVEPELDQETGRYLPDYPRRFSPQEFKSPESDELERILALSDEVLDIIDSHKEWNFVKNALKFFTKAYTSHGYEQLLWYITTLDTLLGEGDKDAFKNKYEREYEFPAKLIAHRAAYLDGTGKGTERIFVNKYLRINRLRNDLVHGNRDLSNDQSLKRDELAWLHEKVRKSILEVLTLLNAIYNLGNFSSYRGRIVPNRSTVQELLHVLKRPTMDLSNVLMGDIENSHDWLFTDGKIDLSL
ncbi:hypothetical protein [Halalkalibaculum sp. DA384]|uniref:hypothetical protein n=1 Tax=Halalkalibaculum sp. DA384 TaxID=3373606 RepID=UPI00375509E4